MALVYWLWLTHPLTRDTVMFDFGEWVGLFLLGGWLRAWRMSKADQIRFAVVFSVLAIPVFCWFDYQLFVWLLTEVAAKRVW